jgi:two-component sensor histidine kinase
MTTGQITIEGEDLNLSPRAAQAIGMALYELMTNAAKYGALSTPAGRIRIDWTIECADEESSFHLEWREQGGPPVPAPTHRGFGHIVIAEMTARSLQGDVVYTFAPEGVIWRLTAPLDAVREQEGAEATDAIRAA